MACNVMNNYYYDMFFVNHIFMYNITVYYNIQLCYARYSYNTIILLILMDPQCEYNFLKVIDWIRYS